MTKAIEMAIETYSNLSGMTEEEVLTEIANDNETIKRSILHLIEGVAK